MSNSSDVRSVAISLWFRLITLSILALVFIESLKLSQGKAQGWSFYLSTAEVAFEVIVRLVFAALVGIVVGTLSTAVIVPFLWYFHSNRERIADWAVQISGVLVFFFLSKYALTVLIDSYGWLGHRRLVETLLMAAFYVTIAAALLIPRTRRKVTTSVRGFLGEKMTRRAAVATVAGTAALIATEYVLARSTRTVKAALMPERPKSNILLITFDALSARDMSLYGYKLPTTPNIDAFARKSTVFTNYYAASTFTTPCIATMLAGIYPSESHIYQLQGKVSPEIAAKGLPHAMRGAGYTTAAFLSSPWAYAANDGFKDDYDSLPEPVFQQDSLEHLWDGTGPLHQDSGVGRRVDEYLDLAQWWNPLVSLPSDLPGRFRAAASFERTRELLAGLPDGHFLWVHVMTPHSPYLPDTQDRGRFLPADELWADEEDLKNHVWFPHYKPDQQSEIDKRRLLYDEFICTADRAFGNFVKDLEARGKLANTTIIMSADHGESFEGGVYHHKSPYLTSPILHIPLVIRTAGQQEGRTITVTADQTSLAPTILEMAGVPKPPSMRGSSLVPWLSGDRDGTGEGRAFSQYFERNSVFKPLRRGSVGVIEGEYQYVVYLDSQKGMLRPLSEAQIWNLDRSAEHPDQAARLRAILQSRFPDLVQ